MRTNEDAERAPHVDLARVAEFRLGALLVQPALRQVVYSGMTETLEPRVMQVLVALAQRQGEVLCRSQLIDVCWKGRAVGDDAVNRAIARVRRLASVSTFSLETIPRVGHRLTVNAPDGGAESMARVDANQGPAEVPPTVRRFRYRVVAASMWVAFMAIAIGGYWLWHATRSHPSTQPDFAMLPFDATGDDGDAAYLAEAIPTSIGSELTRVGFQVVSPTASFEYRGARKGEAAHALNPRFIIDGSLRWDGDSLRVLARVDSAIDNVSVWSQEFTVAGGDAHQLPQRVATALAGLYIFNPAFRSTARNPPHITAGLARVTSRMRASDAMGAYLTARELVRDAPDVAVVQIWHAVTTVNALDLLPANERAELLAGARAAANQAARIAPSGAPSALHMVIPPVDWMARERILRTGIANAFADPSNLRNSLTRFLLETGRVDEAVTFAYQAVTLDPLSSVAAVSYARALENAGRRSEARITLARIQQLWPGLRSTDRLHLAAALSHGELETAAAMLEDPLLQPPLEPSVLDRPYETLVRAMRTRTITDIAEAKRECSDAAKNARDGTGLCLIGFAKLGDLEAFFELALSYFPEMRGESLAERDRRWLANPIAHRSMHVLFKEDMKEIRADERFIAIAARTGLLDYWQRSNQWPDFCESEPQSACARMRVKGQIRAAPVSTFRARPLGNLPPSVPERLADLVATYSLKALRISVTGSVRYNGGLFTSNENDVKVNSFATVVAVAWNASLGTLILRSRNLTDEFYADWSGYASGLVFVGAPRRAEVSYLKES